MDEKDREIARLERRLAGLEKTLRIVTGHSGRTEANLRQLFETVSDTIPVPMLITSETGRILFSNGKAREIFAYSEKDIQGLSAVVLYENPEDRGIFLKTLAEKGEVRNFPIRLKKANASVFPASFFSQPLVFEGQKCLLTVVHDLSEIKKEEEKRLAMEKQLRQTYKMEALGTMAGGIAHDFNNILTVIFGRLELALMVLSEESRAKKHIGDVLKAAERAKEMVKQILAFCRKREDESKSFHIKHAVAEAVAMVRYLTPSNIEIKFYKEWESLIIMGDPTQIHQVVMNLIGNAAHALGNRGGVVEIRIERVSLDPMKKNMMPDLGPGDYVRLTVSDNGPGMEKDVMERVFDPFFTTKPPGEGTGMGLAVVHGIVQGHGGAVSVQSQPGAGTTFHCYFPLVDQGEDVHESEKSLKTVGGCTERILLVDDESDILEAYDQILTNFGYHVTGRKDSHEALALFKENPDAFDLLITDNVMPKMSGIQITSEIRKIRPNLPVIVMTGRGTDDKTFFDIGATAVLRKPFTQNEIGTAVREVLEGAGDRV